MGLAAFHSTAKPEGFSMSRSSIKFACLASLAAMALSFAAPQARADLEIQASVDGGAFTTLTFAPSVPAGSFNAGPIFNVVVGAGPFVITLDSLAGVNGSTSNLMSAELVVVNTGSTSHTLQLKFSINNYSLPSGSPLTMASQAGGDTPGGLTSFTDEAYFDAANVLGSTPGTNNGLQTGIFDGNSFDTGTKTGSFARTGSFSLTDIETYVLSGNSSAHATDSITVTAVPEPASIGMLIAGVPVLGMLWARRRRAKVA